MGADSLACERLPSRTGATGAASTVTGPTSLQGNPGVNGFGYTGATGPGGQLTYLLPSTGNVWVLLGTLTTTMNGNVTQLEI